MEGNTLQDSGTEKLLVALILIPKCMLVLRRDENENTRRKTLRLTTEYDHYRVRPVPRGHPVVPNTNVGISLADKHFQRLDRRCIT